MEAFLSCSATPFVVNFYLSYYSFFIVYLLACGGGGTFELRGISPCISAPMRIFKLPYSDVLLLVLLILIEIYSVNVLC